jgi:uncharacterized protein (DUF1501 family)
MFDLNNPTAFTRRQFVFGGLTLASASLAVPSFLQRSAFALPGLQPGMSSIPGAPEDRILVVVQLSGGNDGLNSVVPYRSGEYYKARPVIGIRENQALKLGTTGYAAEVGLHPNLTGFKELYDDGLMGIVQGVGYPNPNRSHFKSMDIWHTADTTATGDGWLGRYFDSECCGFGKGDRGKAEGVAGPAIRRDGATGIAVGRDAPLAMRGRLVQPISFEDPMAFRWTGTTEDATLASYYEAIAKSQIQPRQIGGESGHEANSEFLVRTALDAQVNSEMIRKAVNSKPRTSYANGRLADQLQMVASMIYAKLKTRVYYVSIGGFDTHDGQGGATGRHANLMRDLSGAIASFYKDLKMQGNDGRVLTMVFSEFGRRVGQNGSNGTDHGTAAPLFLFGPMVKPGVLTDHPSLTDLDQGDLKFRVDFRTVYSALLGGWMKGDAKAVLDGNYAPAPVLKV